MPSQVISIYSLLLLQVPWERPISQVANLWNRVSYYHVYRQVSQKCQAQPLPILFITEEIFQIKYVRFKNHEKFLYLFVIFPFTEQ